MNDYDSVTTTTESTTMNRAFVAAITPYTGRHRRPPFTPLPALTGHRLRLRERPTIALPAFRAAKRTPQERR